MLNTTNYGLRKPEGTDNVNIDDLNYNADQIDSQLKNNADTISTHKSDYTMQIPYVVAIGAANTYAVTLSPAPAAYTDGMAVAVKINVDSTAASTLNVNLLGAKSILKPNGNTIINLKAGSIYTLRYNGTNFILQGSDAAGTATAADILTGKTASTDAGDIIGTMPNKAGSGTTITPITADQPIPQGYYGGVAGDGKVAAVNVPVANVLTGTIIAGAAGAMPNRGAVMITPGTANQAIAAGYHNGNGYVVGDANLISANILSGKNIFGVAGSVIAGKRYASGTVVVTSTTFTITGLLFQPKFILLGLEWPARGSTTQYYVGAYANFGVDTALFNAFYPTSPSAPIAPSFTINSNGFSAIIKFSQGLIDNMHWIAIE